MTWSVVGLNFDHMHAHDLLAHVDEHPDAEIAGLCDENRERSTGDVERAAEEFDVAPDAVFDSVEDCLDRTDPDFALCCPATADHAEYVERVARHDVHVLLEKPFAASLAGVERIVDATADSGKRLAVNWPLAWYPTHRTAKRLVDDGTIGDVVEIHFSGGNAGPWRDSWFFDADAGGGSLLDYLGYGATLGTWLRDGETPREVTAMTHAAPDADVDEQSATVARYDEGLSTFRTSLRTFTSPWEHQPRPKCGFVVVGTEGTVSSYDYEETVRVQTDAHPAGRDVPVDDPAYPHRNPVEYVLHCIEEDVPVEGPLSVETSTKGQRIVEAARRSAQTGESVALDELWSPEPGEVAGWSR